MDYHDKVVIVTGASSGIGWVTAQSFAGRGAQVVGVARREENLRRLADECSAAGGRCSYLAGDLGERSFAESVVDETVARLDSGF